MLPKMTTTAGVGSQPAASGVRPGLDLEGESMRALRREISRLDPETCAAFKESLYRISR